MRVDRSTSRAPNMRLFNFSDVEWYRWLGVRTPHTLKRLYKYTVLNHSAGTQFRQYDYRGKQVWGVEHSIRGRLCTRYGLYVIWDTSRRMVRVNNARDIIARLKIARYRQMTGRELRDEGFRDV